MKTYRTAQGKMVDMGALVTKNERVRAVGNMNVNARGDTIDDNGEVLVPVTQKVGENYQNTVGNKSAQVKGGLKPVQIPAQENLTREELDLDNAFNEVDEKEIAEIKAKETKTKESKK